MVEYEDMISFVVPGNPVAKGRARSFVRNGHVAHYTPEKTANYENLVKLMALECMVGKSLLDGAVSMRISLHVPIPSSWSKKKQEQARNGELRPLTKPDCSNVTKAIEDAMNGIVYVDDKQIVELSVSKYYSELPRAEIKVSECT